jgi:hypothetical protein
MQIKKQAAGVCVSVALTVALVFGGGLPASASTVGSGVLADTPTLPTAELTSDNLRPETDAGEGEKQARVAVIPIITAVIVAGGAAYGMGEKAGARCYHAGLRNAGWQNVKWQARATAMGMIGPVGGAVFITGFENKFYSMI